jgi:spermidine synthase
MKSMFFLLAVLVSGGAGLMYQTIWIRRLGFVFGNTTLSVSIVLSSFFFGMAAGSRWFGKRADDSKSPIKLYRNLEIGIALAALLVAVLLPALNSVYVGLYRSVFGRSLLLVGIAKFGLTFLLLSIPTFLMGGTLPVMTKCYVRSKESFAVSLGIVYGINTIGAVFGLVLMAFVLIELLGLQSSYLVAVGLSCVSALLANFARTEEKGQAEEAVSEAPDESLGSQKQITSWPLYILSFLSGAISLGYEVLWIRLWSFLSLHSAKTEIGYPPAEFSSTYVYSGILGLFLIGISLGGILVKWIRRPEVSPLLQLGWVQIAIGAYTILTLAVERLLLLDGLAIKLVEIAFIVMPTTILMGIGFPLLASAFIDAMKHAGRQFGNFYALNTLGSSLGPIFVGLVFIPLKGTYSCLAFLAILNLMIGAMLLAHVLREESKKVLRTIGVVGIVALIVVVAVPFPVLIPRTRGGFKVLFEEDNHVGHTLVVEYDNGFKDVAVNNYAVSTIDPTHTFGSLTMEIPVSLYGRVPEDILVLCVGSGGSWVSTLKYQSASVTAIDINPAVFRCMPLIHSEDVLKELRMPRMRPVVTDARNFLLLDEKQYDIINIDPAPPITQPGMVNLHTSEFYALAKRRLKPGGILYQRLSTNVESEILYKALIRSIADVFKDVTIWRFLQGGVDIIASDKPLNLLHNDRQLISQRVFERAHLYFECGKKEVDAYTAQMPPVTDNRPFLEYHLLERSGLYSKYNADWSGVSNNRNDLAKLKRPMSDYIKRAGE